MYNDNEHSINYFDHTMSHVKTISEKSFAETVLKAQKPVLVDFFAEWCGPCKAMAPVLEQFAQENTTVDVVKVDVDASPDLVSNYNISSIPTFFLFKNGEVVQSATGAIGKNQLVKLIEAI